MGERVNLVIDDGIGDLLTELAGGERRRGQWISNVVRVMHEQQRQVAGSDIDALRLGFSGLVGQVKGVDARLGQVEGQLAAVISRLQNTA